MSDFLIVTVTPTPAARLELEKAARAIGGEVLSFIPGQDGVQWCAWRKRDRLAVVLTELGFRFERPGLNVMPTSQPTARAALQKAVQYCDRWMRAFTELREMYERQRDTSGYDRSKKACETLAAYRDELGQIIQKLDEVAS